MIKVLKLRKAVIAIILGIIALVVAQIMSSKRVTGSSYVLGLSGFLLIIGALLFLYPILFAKKIDNDGKVVELTPVEKDPLEGESVV
ncbi:isoleucyl-tRNA synthetase [Pedobacter boryungensis]|uniref:Isoleucyl-tRNA synthetase n=1 Tax=Pedobacter boryungensis TaxID=869962 RepID=A0ABX2DDB2_9SPHI|nr:isoleucyl-tRNA synthetase [Pedobacter boryungensis]NQX32022.1 isoleucyl-tRNA synthetase [Pedobacter boryungensis]